MRHAAASEHSFITRAAQRQQSSDPLPPSRGGDQRRQQQQRDYCQHCAAVAAILRQQALSLWAATKEHEEPQLYLRSGNDLVGFPAGACRRVHACPGNAGSWLSMAASPCPRRPARRQSPPGRLPSCLPQGRAGRSDDRVSCTGGSSLWRPAAEVSDSQTRRLLLLLPMLFGPRREPCVRAPALTATQPSLLAPCASPAAPKQLAMMDRSWMAWAKSPSRSFTRSLQWTGPCAQGEAYQV